MGVEKGAVALKKVWWRRRKRRGYVEVGVVWLASGTLGMARVAGVIVVGIIGSGVVVVVVSVAV